jgi:sugar/nucleoside kinase (ribokinase family)
MTYRGLFVGATTIDIQYLVDTFPSPNSKMFATQFGMSTGGPATNAAITFSYLGGQSHLLSAIGNHPFTHFMNDELERYRVSSKGMTPASHNTPPVSSIISTPGQGHRAVVTWASRKIPNSTDVMAGMSLEEFDVVLVDGFYMDVCQAAARQAKEAAVPVVLDGGSWKDGVDSLLPHVDIAICSENFYPPGLASQTSALRYLRDRGIEHAAITQGERPIIYSSIDGEGEITIDAVDVVDTLGAGDIFHGAFCYYYAKRKAFIAALKDAARIATLSCQSFGTRAWMQEQE